MGAFVTALAEGFGLYLLAGDGAVKPQRTGIDSHSKRTEKAKPMGYYMNILGKMPITKVQIRLIVKELERIAFDDVHSMTKSEQEKIFSSVVQKYCKVSDLSD